MDLNIDSMPADQKIFSPFGSRLDPGAGARMFAGVTHDNYVIRVDYKRRLLRITSRGVWTIAVVDQYRRDVRAILQVLADHGCAVGDVCVLLDTRMLHVQSRDVADYYGRQPIYSGGLPRKVALLAESLLVGMQLKRIGIGNKRIFLDEQEAIDWLFAEGED